MNRVNFYFLIRMHGSSSHPFRSWSGGSIVWVFHSSFQEICEQTRSSRKNYFRPREKPQRRKYGKRWQFIGGEGWLVRWTKKSLLLARLYYTLVPWHSYYGNCSRSSAEQSTAGSLVPGHWRWSDSVNTSKFLQTYHSTQFSSDKEDVGPLFIPPTTLAPWSGKQELSRRIKHYESFMTTFLTRWIISSPTTQRTLDNER